MRKSDLKMLEKVFSAEIEDRLPYQSKSKQILWFADGGYVQPMTQVLPGPLPILVSGYQLTHLGRLTYCMSCNDDGMEE